MRGIDLAGELARLAGVKSEVRVGEDGRIVRSNYREAAEAVRSLAERAGLEAEVLNLEVKDGFIPTVIIDCGGSGPTLSIVSHYDVVPAGDAWVVNGRVCDPYKPILIGDKLYGRGVADDKSAIVASIAGMGELLEEGARRRYRVSIVVTGDEEVGGNGVRALLDSGYRCDRAVILDAGADYVSIGASGVIHGWIRVEGRSGHAGYPHRTVNPVEALARLVCRMADTYKAARARRISRYPSPPGSPLPRVWGRASFTILKTGAGEKHNIVPGEALAGFDVRLLPEEGLDEALAELYSYFSEALAGLGVKASIEAWGQNGWYALDEGFVGEAVSAASRAYSRVGLSGVVGVAAELGGNDGTFFFNRGIPVVAFGAMREDCNVHSENEFVYMRDVEMLKEFVKELARGEAPR